MQKDVNQGRVSIGLPTVKRDNPDVYALEVMNEILGGSGFTSRITKTVRSNEGLAYSAGSGFAPGIWYPGPLPRRVPVEEPHACRAATELVLEEITQDPRRGRSRAEELDTIKNSLIQTFPSSFASKAQSMAIFASTSTRGATRPTGRPTATASGPSPRPTCSAWRSDAPRARRR